MSVYWPCWYPKPVPASSYIVYWPLPPANTRSVSGADPAVAACPDDVCSGTMPPALTNTGIRFSGTESVWVDGPVKVAPVNQSVHRPGGNQTVVVATLPGVVTGATSMSVPSRYSVGWS